MRADYKKDKAAPTSVNRKSDCSAIFRKRKRFLKRANSLKAEVLHQLVYFDNPECFSNALSQPFIQQWISCCESQSVLVSNTTEWNRSEKNGARKRWLIYGSFYPSWINLSWIDWSKTLEINSREATLPKTNNKRQTDSLSTPPSPFRPPLNTKRSSGYAETNAINNPHSKPLQPQSLDPRNEGTKRRRSTQLSR